MLTSGFYNSLNHDRRYDAIQISSIFDGIIADGVFVNVGNSLMVKASSGMSINVDTGRAWFNHTWTYNDSLYPLVIPESNPILKRIDAVVLEVNRSLDVRSNIIKIVSGEYGSEDLKKPEMIHDEYIDQYALAYITIEPQITSIEQRFIENVIGTSETPFVTGLIDTLNAEELLLRWDNDYNRWKEISENDFETWKNEEMLDYEDWFTNLQNQLDDNQAAHLQNQIDNLSYRIITDEEIDSMFE